jgi:hypothetical protein
MVSMATFTAWLGDPADGDIRRRLKGGTKELDNIRGTTMCQMLARQTTAIGYDLPGRKLELGQRRGKEHDREW